MVEKIKGWDWKLLVYIAGLVFFAGVYVTTLKDNCVRLKKVEDQTNINKENYIRVDQRLLNIEQGVSRIEKKLE